jgi:hypothetical protein
MEETLKYYGNVSEYVDMLFLSCLSSIEQRDMHSKLIVEKLVDDILLTVKNSKIKTLRDMTVLI